MLAFDTGHIFDDVDAAAAVLADDDFQRACRLARDLVGLRWVGDRGGDRQSIVDGEFERRHRATCDGLQRWRAAIPAFVRLLMV